LNEPFYRSVVSGAAAGWKPSAMRVLLRGLSVPYGGIIRVRNLLYDGRMLPSHSAEAVVVSIGNLTTGGTGKTPLVIWLANALTRKGIRCAILTRGYKTRAGSLSDEPALLAKACEETPVVVNPDRAAGARKAAGVHHAQVVILDDGFQHRRLRRDMDIVAIDATCPFGYGRMLPAGLLREPIGSLRRADAVVITRFDQASEEQIAQIETRIHQIRAEMPVYRAVHRHTEARTFHGQRSTAGDLGGKKVFVFCGIGNPSAFVSSVESLGCRVAGKQIFDDHHAYTPQELKTILGRAGKLGAEVILTTEKDWVKAALLTAEKSEIPLVYLTMELEFLTCPDTITEKIERLVLSKSGKDSP